MNNITHFFESNLETSQKENENDLDIDNYLRAIKEVSNIMTESLYVVDLHKRSFLFVADHDLFLCGHSPEEVTQLGYAFYPQIYHPDDLHLHTDIQDVIRKHLYASGADLSDLNYYSFTLRMRNYLEYGQRSEYLMVYHRVRPVIIREKMQIVFYALSSSVIEKSGNLRIYYKTNLTFDEYSFEVKRWQKRKVEKLTKQEQRILKLAKQGKNAVEISKSLCLSYHTVRNEKMRIFDKLGVHSIEEAIVFATNHRMIFVSSKQGVRQEPTFIPKIAKKTRRMPTPDVWQCLQQGLDNGQSIRSIAKQEGVWERTVRYAIKQGKLSRKAI
jgi:DNA-binding CsgD family transcriptional regulator